MSSEAAITGRPDDRVDEDIPDLRDGDDRTGCSRRDPERVGQVVDEDESGEGGEAGRADGSDGIAADGGTGQVIPGAGRKWGRSAADEHTYVYPSGVRRS